MPALSFTIVALVHVSDLLTSKLNNDYPSVLPRWTSALPNCPKAYIHNGTVAVPLQDPISALQHCITNQADQPRRNTAIQLYFYLVAYMMYYMYDVCV